MILINGFICLIMLQLVKALMETTTERLQYNYIVTMGEEPHTWTIGPLWCTVPHGLGVRVPSSHDYVTNYYYD